jgi:hypothetical protein
MPILLLQSYSSLSFIHPLISYCLCFSPLQFGGARAVEGEPALLVATDASIATSRSHFALDAWFLLGCAVQQLVQCCASTEYWKERYYAVCQCVYKSRPLGVRNADLLCGRPSCHVGHLGTVAGGVWSCGHIVKCGLARECSPQDVRPVR